MAKNKQKSLSIVLAGGEGTRLMPLTRDRAKPAVPFGGVPGAAMLVYQRAVFSHAKGLLLAQFRTIERREAANNDAKEGRESADAFFAFAHDAIADLLGCSRVDVALI